MDEFLNPENAAQPSPEASGSPLQLQATTPLPPEPWGIWATVGWSVLVGGASLIAQIAAVFVFMAVFTVANLAANGNPRPDALQIGKGLESNGLLLSIAVCLSSLAGSALTILAAHLRWPGSVKPSISPLRAGTPVFPEPPAPATPVESSYTWRNYLALSPISPRILLAWMGMACLFAIASDAVTSLLGRPIVPEFMQKAYATAHFVPLLWIAFIIVGPVFEELFFRGFLFRGLANSKLGAVGAILVTSLLWAAIHIQYDAYGIFSIFIVGLLLGWARVRTNSIYPCIAMHCLMNFIATTEAALQHAGIMK